MFIDEGQKSNIEILEITRNIKLSTTPWKMAAEAVEKHWNFYKKYYVTVITWVKKYLSREEIGVGYKIK